MITHAGGVNRGSDHTSAVRLELARAVGSRRKPRGEEEDVIAPGGALGERLDGRAARRPPIPVSGGIVPIGDDQAGRAAQHDTEIGIRVEEPAAGDVPVGDASSMRAETGLEVFGARLERQYRDAQGQPPAGARETRLAQASRRRRHQI